MPELSAFLEVGKVGTTVLLLAQSVYYQKRQNID